MHQTRHIFIILLTAVTLTSCFKSYEPVILATDEQKLVVSGLVTDRGGKQTVTISTSSSVNKPEESPVTGCKVTIMDDQGHQFPLVDSAADGNYRGWIDAMYITNGCSFKVEIITPDGSIIVSDYDKMSSCPEVDSVYYTRKNLPTSDPEAFTEGIQFYIDLDGASSDSKYYRWEAVETWEYHSDYPIEWMYNGGKVIHIYPPDYSKDTCWSTLVVRNIFTLSTLNLAENKYQQAPLHFVDNTTSRLLYGYSLLVNQYSLSDTAYKYWNQLNVNSTDEGGLYERQPMASKGNLHNLTHPDKEVLGFFGVSAVKSKRIFIEKINGLELEYKSPCIPVPMSKWGFASYSHLPKPLYLFGNEKGYEMILMNVECVDCTSMWGKNKKPDFWPK